MFGRVITAMVTPFDQKLEVDYLAAADLAQYLASNGSDGIVVAGTTGETPTLSMEEKYLLCRAVKEAVGDRCKVIAGVGTNSTKDSVQLTQKINGLDLDGVMAVVPYYNKPSQEGLYEHFRRIAEAADVPVMLYNIPGRTGINMLPQTVYRLAEIPNITCIKEAAGIMDQVSELRSNLPAEFAIYAGDDSLTLPMLSLGGTGIVSVASHLVGNKIKTMIEAFLAGDLERALKWHLLLFPIFKAMFVTTNPVPVKYLIKEIGLRAGGYRLPIVDPSPDEIVFLQDLLKKIQQLPQEV